MSHKHCRSGSRSHSDSFRDFYMTELFKPTVSERFSAMLSLGFPLRKDLKSPKKRFGQFDGYCHLMTVNDIAGQSLRLTC